MAQGLKKTSKVARKTKNVTKRQRTAAAKKTVKKTIKDQVKKKINAQIEKNTGGKAARGGQHFELSAISDSSKQKAKERAIAVATKREESAGIFGP
ncbi:hypothetical protein JL722_6201 [Aureococcus anophagefferens]|nr:hypothetical protein JL722_6201 [Aureococcus anophagefferens]